MNGSRTALPAAWLCLLALCLAAAGFSAEPPLPPKPTAYFSDNAGVVSADAAHRLNERLKDFERETSNQILVAVYPNLPDGSALEDYTVRTAQSWGTGQKARQNGLVLFVFVKDKKMRMEVGYGLEGVVPDGVAGSIIREVIAPQFKTGAYDLGLEKGVDAIIRATKGEYKGTGRTHTEGGSASGVPFYIWILIALVIAFFIWCNMGDTVFQRTGRSVLWGVLNVALSSSGRGGGGSRSDGGGYSGGGGTFGGGGASGSW